MIKNIEIANWNMTRIFLNNELPLLRPVLPLSTEIGLKDERKNAGYEPEMTPTMRPSANNEGITIKLSK